MANTGKWDGYFTTDRKHYNYIRIKNIDIMFYTALNWNGLICGTGQTKKYSCTKLFKSRTLDFCQFAGCKNKIGERTLNYIKENSTEKEYKLFESIKNDFDFISITGFINPITFKSIEDYEKEKCILNGIREENLNLK